MRWTSRAAALSAALGAAVALVAPATVAAEAPTVGLAVVPARGGDLVAGRGVTSKFMRRFAGDSGASLVDVMALLQQMSRPPRPDYLQDMQRGLDQQSSGEFGAARRTLSRVMSVMRRSLAAVRLDELAFVQLHLAAAELGAGRRRAAARLMNDLATWRRGQRLPALSGQAPTDWDDLLAAAQVEPEGGDGVLEVVSSPEGAFASLDGRPLGATPVLATSLPLGTHYLEVALPGYKPAVVAVSVRSRRRSVSVRLRRDEQAADTVDLLLGARSSLGKPRLPGLGRLERQLGVDQLLVITVLPSGQGLRLRGFLYELSRQRLLASAEVRSAAALLPRQLTPLRLWGGGPIMAVTRDRPREDSFTAQVPEGPPTPWYKRWYLWTVVGAAVVAAVVLPVTLSPKDDSTPPERYMIRW